MFMLMPAFSEENYCSPSLEGQKSVFNLFRESCCQPALKKAFHFLFGMLVFKLTCSLSPRKVTAHFR